MNVFRTQYEMCKQRCETLDQAVKDLGDWVDSYRYRLAGTYLSVLADTAILPSEVVQALDRMTADIDRLTRASHFSCAPIFEILVPKQPIRHIFTGMQEVALRPWMNLLGAIDVQDFDAISFFACFLGQYLRLCLHDDIFDSFCPYRRSVASCARRTDALDRPK